MKTAFLRVVNFILYLWRTVVQLYVCRKCGRCRISKRKIYQIMKSHPKATRSHRRDLTCQGGERYDK